MTSFTTSPNGVLAYRPRSNLARLVWIDRSGREVGTVGVPADYLRLRTSSDGRRALIDRARPGIGTYDLWEFDLARGVETRLTSDPGSEVGGVWLPDGSAVIFSADRGGPPHLFRKDRATGVEHELLAVVPEIVADEQPLTVVLNWTAELLKR